MKAVHNVNRVIVVSRLVQPSKYFAGKYHMVFAFWSRSFEQISLHLPPLPRLSITETPLRQMRQQQSPRMFG